MNDVRNRILKAATDRFLVDGFSATRMDDLASEIGVSKKTLYQHFDTKEAIISAIFEERFAAISEAHGKILASGMTSMEKLARILETNLRMIPPSTQFLADIQRNAPAVWRRINDYRTGHVREIWGSIIDNGIASGELRSDLNRELFLDAFQGAMRHVADPERLLLAHYSLPEAIRGLLELFAFGILVRPANP